VVGVNDVVGQEETDTFELGFKSELLDNRLRLNASVFNTVINGLQYYVFIGDVGGQVLVNIDEVELKGGEIELLASLAEGLEIYAGAGYTDSEITRYALNPAAVGNEAPYVPGSTFNLGGQYRFPVSKTVNGFVRVDYEHRGAQFWDPENTTDRSAIDLVGVRLGVEAESGKWSLIASVDNATDEIYNSEWVLGGFAHPALPRVWSVDYKYNF
jgi:iron complex outermembrane receptor protein